MAGWFSLDAGVPVEAGAEGLDLPEVTLVAVFDADKEGYLRSKTSLIQTCGRASRSVDARVILYADKRTDSIEGAIAEMDRRRSRQRAHNEAHGVVPKTITKAVRDLLEVPPDEDGEMMVGVKKGQRPRPGQAGA